jgi:hypothetical protein
MTIPFVPASFTSGIRPPTFLIAGLLLFIGALFRGHILGFLMWFSAAVVLFADALDIPGIHGHVAASAFVAAVIWVIAVVFTRAKFD